MKYQMICTVKESTTGRPETYVVQFNKARLYYEWRDAQESNGHSIIAASIYIKEHQLITLGKDKNMLKVSPNHTKKTFTIRKDGVKYRTCEMSKDEFDSCLNNTERDWKIFLKSNNYYTVKN